MNKCCHFSFVSLTFFQIPHMSYSIMPAGGIHQYNYSLDRVFFCFFTVKVATQENNICLFKTHCFASISSVYARVEADQALEV